MDANRFDALAKALVSETNRRRTLGRLLGGVVGAIGLAGADDALAAKSGDCKKECDLCKFCKPGKCRKSKGGKKRCKTGKCKRQENGTPCASVGGVCQIGRCVCPDGSENCGANCCLNNHICQNGACACAAAMEECDGVCVPVCAAGAEARDPSDCTCCRVAGLSCPNDTMFAIGGPDCCSSICNSLAPPVGECGQGFGGSPCLFDSDCVDNNCTDGLCVAD